MTPADWDREPTSDAERARWRVDGKCWVVTDDSPSMNVALCATPELAAEAVWAHNVMHAAREQRALGVGLHDGCVAREALVRKCMFHGQPIGPPPATNCAGCRGEIDHALLRTDEHGQAT